MMHKELNQGLLRSADPGAQAIAEGFKLKGLYSGLRYLRRRADGAKDKRVKKLKAAPSPQLPFCHDGATVCPGPSCPFCVEERVTSNSSSRSSLDSNASQCLAGVAHHV